MVPMLIGTCRSRLVQYLSKQVIVFYMICSEPQLCAGSTRVRWERWDARMIRLGEAFVVNIRPLPDLPFSTCECWKQHDSRTLGADVSMINKYTNKQRGLLAVIMAMVMVFAGAAFVAAEVDAATISVSEGDDLSEKVASANAGDIIKIGFVKQYSHTFPFFPKTGIIWSSSPASPCGR